MDNQKLLTFAQMSASERAIITEAFVAGDAIELYDTTNRQWKTKNIENGFGCLYACTIYRIPDDVPSINWAHVAPQYRYMARDANGRVFLYDSKPVLHSRWSHDTAAHWVIRDVDGANAIDAKMFASLVVGDNTMASSLVIRPEGV